MKKSILKTMLFGSCVVVLMTFLVISMVFSKYVKTDALNHRAEILKNNMTRIDEISTVAFANKSTNMDVIYNVMLENISYTLDCSIIVFDRDGKIIALTGLNRNKFLGDTLKDDLYKPVISGAEITKVGLLDHLYSGESMLTVASPIESNGLIVGGIFLNQPVPSIKTGYDGLMYQFIIVILSAMIFSVILFYFISKKITNPIKEMNKTVTEFSKGDFSHRVEYAEENEIGELADSINNMADSLENLEKMRSNFVSDVSHELRTPMTTISGFVEGILDGTVDENEKNKYLEIVLSETKRLSKLVTDLLNISRMEGDKLKLNMSDFDICDLTYQALFKFEKPIEEKNISLDFDIKDEKISVEADKDAITQVLINLINNAVKFTPTGGNINIRIWKHQMRAYVEIKNSGDGIAEDELKYIWDRFYKTDTSRSADRTGFGLGLYIVNSIIKRHGEKIWADSLVGEYTSFTFSTRLSK